MQRSSALNHALAPMLTPRSIALVGASRKRNSVGSDSLRNLLSGGFRGAVYPVNPSYRSLYGRECYADITLLPEPVDLAILSVPNSVLERCVEEAIASGARALAIFASAELEGDGKNRIAAMARAARVPVCGANCMGFFNAEHALRAFSALFPDALECGGITCIAQSGSLLQALLFNDQRLKFNLAVSSGQELVTSAADFMDFALDQPSTELIALVLESVRDPVNFIQALEKAQRCGVPVIALKLARTEAAAKLALSHTGAIAGNAQVYEALFQRYGVISVRDPSELAATAILLSAPRKAAAGGLSVILDSGGERELVVDVAAEVGVRFAQISAGTARILRENLDPGLEPINPLDAWGTGRDFEQVFEICLSALLDDPDTAMGMFVCDLSDDLDLHAAYALVCEAVARSSSKLLVVMSNYSAWSHRRNALRLSGAGIPVLDGTQSSLRAVKHALEYRDFLIRRDAPQRVPVPGNPRAEYWRGILSSRTVALGEDEGYALLADYGIAVPRHCIVDSGEAALAAARTIGFPVVLKTAAPGILHKSEVGGVRLGISDELELAAAYDQISARLGARMLVSALAQGSVEMAFGLVRDQTFGAFLMVAFGGTWIEYLQDRQLAMAPVDAVAAAQLISNLRLAKVLQGVRGAAPCDHESLVQTFVRLSQLASELGPCIAEMDINPVLVGPSGVIAVDCLIIPGCVRAGHIPQSEHSNGI
jgi:acetate---CoA ligase (ADP-forming)